MSAPDSPKSWHPAAMRSFRIVSRLGPLAAATAVVTLLTLSCKEKPAENAVDAAPAVSSVAPATNASAPASASAAAPASAGGGHGGGHGGGEGRRGHGGPSEMLFTAAKGLELKDEQKTKIEAARTAAQAGPDDATREAMKASAKDLHTDLLAGIKAGKIDTAKLEPRYAAIEKAAQVTHEKEAEGLNALHAALDATQRKAAVADVRAKMAARENKMGHRDGPGGPDGGRGPGAKRSIDRLTRGLDLDAEQQKKVDAIAAKDDGKGGRPDPAEMKKRVETLLAAFEKDTFDAKKVDAFDAKKARGMMDHESKVLVQLVPVLKPEQREKLAAKMEKGQSPHGRRGPGGSAGFGHRQPAEDDDDD